ncbi:MAG: cobalamin-binding protein [Nitrospiraceae bacterium]
MRISSLLPGATEVVAALGLADELVGISHECDYPPQVRRKPVVVRAAIDAECAASPEIDQQVRKAVEAGQDLYELDEVLFARAEPDLVITQDLCHVCAITPSRLQRAIATLPKAPTLLTLTPATLDQILTDVERIGHATGKEAEAHALTVDLRTRLEGIRERVSHAGNWEVGHPKVACLEWLDPLYAAGHWVPEMVSLAGGVDVLGTAGAPSQQVTWEQVRNAAPDVLVLMPCGFSVDRTVREWDCLTYHPGWRSLPSVQNGRVFVVDASAYFSRPGPRLVEGVAILAALCHPAAFGCALPPGVRRVGPLARPRPAQRS